jgi:hypothetical protein
MPLQVNLVALGSGLSTRSSRGLEESIGMSKSLQIGAPIHNRSAASIKPGRPDWPLLHRMSFDNVHEFPFCGVPPLFGARHPGKFRSKVEEWRSAQRAHDDHYWLLSNCTSALGSREIVVSLPSTVCRSGTLVATSPTRSLTLLARLSLTQNATSGCRNAARGKSFPEVGPPRLFPSDQVAP